MKQAVSHSFGTGCAYERGPTPLQARTKLRKRDVRLGSTRINNRSEQLGTKLPMQLGLYELWLMLASVHAWLLLLSVR